MTTDPKGPLPPWTKPFELKLVEGTVVRVADIVQEIVLDRLPEAMFISYTDRAVEIAHGMTLIFGKMRDSNPWRDAQDVAQAYGCQVTFDSDAHAFELHEDPSVIAQ